MSKRDKRKMVVPIVDVRKLKKTLDNLPDFLLLKNRKGVLIIGTKKTK